MRYHFGPELTVEPCSFGEHCPAKHHFGSEREATSTLESAQRLSKRSLTSPITGLSGTDLELFLRVILEAKAPSLYGPNPATKLRKLWTAYEPLVERFITQVLRPAELKPLINSALQV